MDYTRTGKWLSREEVTHLPCIVCRSDERVATNTIRWKADSDLSGSDRIRRQDYYWPLVTFEADVQGLGRRGGPRQQSVRMDNCRRRNHGYRAIGGAIRTVLRSSIRNGRRTSNLNRRGSSGAMDLDRTNERPKPPQQPGSHECSRAATMRSRPADMRSLRTNLSTTALSE